MSTLRVVAHWGGNDWVGNDWGGKAAERRSTTVF